MNWIERAAEDFEKRLAEEREQNRLLEESGFWQNAADEIERQVAEINDVSAWGYKLHDEEVKFTFNPDARTLIDIRFPHGYVMVEQHPGRTYSFLRGHDFIRFDGDNYPGSDRARILPGEKVAFFLALDSRNKVLTWEQLPEFLLSYVVDCLATI